MYFVPHFGHAKVYETSIWTPCFQISAKTLSRSCPHKTSGGQGGANGGLPAHGLEQSIPLEAPPNRDLARIFITGCPNWDFKNLGCPKSVIEKVKIITLIRYK